MKDKTKIILDLINQACKLNVHHELSEDEVSREIIILEMQDIVDELMRLLEND